MRVISMSVSHMTTDMCRSS